MGNQPATKYEYITTESESQENAMQSGDNVKVRSGKNFIKETFWGFEPIGEKNKPKGVGLIYYPGALVAGERYSPIARSLAELGYHVAVARFPGKIAILDTDRAEEVLKYKPWKDTVKSWVIAGHSLGGAMACAYLKKKASTTEQLKGLVLHAAYPGEGEFKNGDLKDSGLKVTSIWAKLDGLTTKEKIDDAKKLLPDNTTYVAIEGGNHTQFYYKGNKLQDGDKEATISLNEQQLIIREETHKMLLAISD